MGSSVVQTLCLLALAAGAYANPVPVPPPLTTASDATCTTVLTSTISGFDGDFTPRIAKTVYTKTVTEPSFVPCGGCALSVTTELAPDWGGLGPQEIITATITADHASTTTVPVCNGSPAAPPAHHGQIPRAEAPSPSRGCTYTKVLTASPLPLTGGTKTIFTTTATTTSHIDCSGCSTLTLSTADYLNPGPVVVYKSTVTASTPAEDTAYVCLKTPSVVLPPSTARRHHAGS